MKIERHALIVCAFVTIAPLISCQLTGKSKQLYATSSEANNKIMSLNKNVKTIGERRIKALSENYPSVATFLENKGNPKYLAESIEHDDHMIVFYYPEEKKAYACRYAIGSTTEMEFSGPFPITDQEMAYLQKVENGKSESFPEKKDDSIASFSRWDGIHVRNDFIDWSIVFSLRAPRAEKAF